MHTTLMHFTKYCCLLIFTIYAISFFACKADSPASNEPVPFLEIENGQFDVEVIVVDENDDGQGPRGSGTLSFDYSGDIPTGSFSATGSYTTGQSTDQGVGAVITKIENIDFQVLEEFISLLAFRPIGNGKADIFVLASTTPVDSLTPGLTYLISPLGPFGIGLFLRGIDIDAFLQGEGNLINAAEQAFVFIEGLVSIGFRNDSQLKGTFSGRTEISSLAKREALAQKLSKIIKPNRALDLISQE